MAFNETLIPFLNITLVQDQPTSTKEGSLISNALMSILTLIVYGVFCQSISIFSVIGNIINMIIFTKMGLKESINVSLLALAISDVGACATYVWLNTCMVLSYIGMDNLSFVPNDILYLTAGWPHAYFARISGFITGFITFERCLCVIAPLKVKTIITRKRFIIFIIFTCIMFIAIVYPIYHTSHLGWVFFTQFNRSLVAMVHTEERAKVTIIVQTIANGFFPAFIFCFIAIATTVLVIGLKKTAKWRLTMTAKTDSGQSNEVATKEQKISKMVVMVSSFSIACFLPQVLLSIAIVFEPRLDFNKEYNNLLMVLYSFVNIPEATNPAVNIFIYYFKSSNYRTTFDRIFRNKKHPK